MLKVSYTTGGQPARVGISTMNNSFQRAYAVLACIVSGVGVAVGAALTILGSSTIGIALVVVSILFAYQASTEDSDHV